MKTWQIYLINLTETVYYGIFANIVGFTLTNSCFIKTSPV